MIKIKGLTVSIDNKEIIKDLDLTIKEKEIIALMGTNGSGKTTLSNALMGNPEYKIISGSITFNDEDITFSSPEERAKKGIFLSFQHPVTVPGVTLAQFLRLSYNAVHKEKLTVFKFKKKLDELMKELHMPLSFADRYLNEGFSGGEKKKAEILQLMMLKPKLAILDETDSGLDIDALKTISSGIKKMEKTSFLIITHYKRILEEIRPDKVLIMKNGRIVEEGGMEIADKLEKEGFGVIA